MRNAITNRSKDYEMPAHSGNEFRHFLSHLRSIFDMPEELETNRKSNFRKVRTPSTYWRKCPE